MSARKSSHRTIFLILQRITFGADRLKPALNIEKAHLPHDSLAPSAHGPLPSASQIRSDLARRIFRGALKVEVTAVVKVEGITVRTNIKHSSPRYSSRVSFDSFRASLHHRCITGR